MSVIEAISKSDEETRAFKNAMRHLASAVSVVTTGRGEQRTGFTASSVTSLSMEPPTLLVCLNRQSSAAPVLLEHGAFCINVLAKDQVDLADAFAGRDGRRGAARYRMRDGRKCRQVHLATLTRSRRSTASSKK